MLGGGGRALDRAYPSPRLVGWIPGRHGALSPLPPSDALYRTLQHTCLSITQPLVIRKVEKFEFSDYSEFGKRNVSQGEIIQKVNFEELLSYNPGV